MNPVDWAFRQDLGTAELLVLVYLATRANRAGVGLWNRDELEQLTGYKRRSIQRILKSLRDDKLLEDRGDWFVLAIANYDDRAPLEQLTELDVSQPPDSPARGQILSQADMDRAGDVIAQHITDAAAEFLDQVMAFEQRLGQQLGSWQRDFAEALQRLIQAGTAAAPPPDPVLEHPLYAQLTGTGLDPEIAYAAVVEQLKREQAKADPKAPDTPPAPKPEPAAGELYSDDARGRAERVFGILHYGDSAARLSDAQLTAWEKLEAEENKHTVTGEVDAFELLYPAIVDAARRAKPGTSFDAFLDPRAIAEGRAPWDADPAPTPMEDRTLEAEIAGMIADLEASNDPRCQVQPRTVEKGDDGVTRTESIVAYHKRVRAKWLEMRKLKSMGVIDG